MSIVYNNTTLSKIEEIFKQLGYKLRYEKGNFKTSACLLQHNRVVVVNKFSDMESKINNLISLILQLNVEDSGLLSEKNRAFFHTIKQTKLNF